MYVCVYIYTYIHTYIHTYTHTHIHTNIYTAVVDQGAHENGGFTGGSIEESDGGLLSDYRDHKVLYTGEDGQDHYYRPYGIVTSVHRGKRLLCLKNCDRCVGVWVWVWVWV